MRIAQLARLLPLAVSLLLPAAVALAQSTTNYPTRTVTIVLPITPGGNPDVLARVIAQKLTERLGKSFVVDNKPGAGGNIGASYAAKSPPDGYTLALLTSAEMSINPNIYANLLYSPKDFVPIAALAGAPTVLAVDAKLPVKNVAQFIEYAKSRPQQLNYGSSGSGSIQQFTAAMFANQVGLNMTHVPYKGSAQVVPALVSGEVQAAFVGIPLVKDLADQGRVRVLAISSAQRSKALPDVPTMMEAGVPNFAVVTTMGLFAPAGTPDAVKQRLASELAQVMAAPEVQAKLATLGMELTSMTPQDYSKAIEAETASYGKAVKQLGIRID